MLTLAIALCLGAQTPKTFEDFEIAKIEATHGIKHFRCEFTVTISVAAAKDSVITVVSLLDGDRSHVTITLPDGSVDETIDDGSTFWSLFSSNKTYYELKGPRTDHYDPKEGLLKAHDSIQFNFSTDKQMQFAADPEFEAQPAETVQADGKTLRKVVASVTLKKTGNLATITQWFLPDRWILKRALLVGKIDEGTFTLTGEVTKLDFKATCLPTDFRPDPATLAAYTRTDSPQPPGSSKN